MRCKYTPTFWIELCRAGITQAKMHGQRLSKVYWALLKFAHFHIHVDTDLLKQNVLWCADQEDKYAAFLTEVSQRTGRLVAFWQNVGFVHGVLNTDNMSILGETIDYGYDHDL